MRAVCGGGEHRSKGERGNARSKIGFKCRAKCGAVSPGPRPPRWSPPEQQEHTRKLDVNDCANMKRRHSVS